MIKRAGELRTDVVTNLMKGDGDINRVHLFEAEDFCGKGRLYARHIIAPGNSIGFHQHEGEQEAYYILKGEALYSDNGNEIVIKDGDFTLCRSGEGHSIKNIGDSDLEFIGLIHNV